MITQAQLAAYQAAEQHHFKLRDGLCARLANGEPVEPGALTVRDDVTHMPDTTPLALEFKLGKQKAAQFLASLPVRTHHAYVVEQKPQAKPVPKPKAMPVPKKPGAKLKAKAAKVDSVPPMIAAADYEPLPGRMLSFDVP